MTIVGMIRSRDSTGPVSYPHLDVYKRQLLNELNEKKYYVTKLATTGGFLKKGNTTLLMGIEDEQVEEVCEIIRQHSGKRQQIMYTPPAPSNVNVYNSVSSVPVNVEVGGATIFILPVEEERKV